MQEAEIGRNVLQQQARTGAELRSQGFQQAQQQAQQAFEQAQSRRQQAAQLTGSTRTSWRADWYICCGSSWTIRTERRAISSTRRARGRTAWIIWYARDWFSCWTKSRHRPEYGVIKFTSSTTTWF